MTFTLTELLDAARSLSDEERNEPAYNRALIDLVLMIAKLPREAGTEIVRAALAAS